MKTRIRSTGRRLRLQIRQAIAEMDGVESNRRVTHVHSLLGQALQKITGQQAGPNFHNWATWGSLKAAETIGQRQLPKALRDVTWSLTGVGILFAIGAACVSTLMAGAITILFSLVLVVMGRCFIRRAMLRSAGLILEGNRIVLEDIGEKTAQFLACFESPRHERRIMLKKFFRSFVSGHTTPGGQDLLKQAFRCYLRARNAATIKEKWEAAYFGNCLAVLHEHYRLQPYIEGSMPFFFRRYATRWMMKFQVGSRVLSVAKDLVAEGQAVHPLLQELTSRKLSAFLSTWDRSSEFLKQTSVGDWSVLSQRMNYIVNLFRALHHSPEVV